jgi:DNA-binding MarR family transcriptional regulator
MTPTTPATTPSTTPPADPPPLPAAFAARLPLLLVKLGDLVLLLSGPGLRELDLSGRQYAALAVLADDRPGSQQELARVLGLVPGLVVGLLDDLEARGLVARRRSAEDRRRTVVELTDAGRELLARADALAARVQDDLLADAGPAEREALHGVVRAAVGRAWHACGGYS